MPSTETSVIVAVVSIRFEIDITITKIKNATTLPYYANCSLYDENGEPRIERDYEG